MEGGGGGEGSTSGARFPILQANRDPESNWEVDVAKSLEEYLLRICSGEINGEDAAHSVNFAEAALLLQGSVQVYSRKVEYLYTLVLNALEFLSQKKQDQENNSTQTNENDPSTVPNDEDDVFSGLDDVPVEARTTLDNNVDRDDLQRKIMRPPANLLVFEGDCLDSEASELDSYLLATCVFFGDFLLLDPCDAPAVSDFLGGKHSAKKDIFAGRGSSARSKSRSNVFVSPNGRSGGTGRRPIPGKVQEGNPEQTQESNPDQSQEMNATQTQESIDDLNVNDNHWSDHSVDHDFPDNDKPHPEDADTGCPDAGNDSDSDDDPWRPLNPHEPGNLKIRPYRKVKGFARQVTGAPKRKMIASLFPMAKMDGVISPDLAKSFEVHLSQQETSHASESPPLYEKLRRSLEHGERESQHVFGDLKDGNEADIGLNDFDDIHEPDMPDDVCDMDVDMDIPTYPDKNNDATLDGTQGTQDSTDAHESLEDLCRSHLDALLASIAEAEQQTELDARVSTWKERIEHALEEQDRNPPFDIGSYGEQIIDTLSSRAENEGIASFCDIVSGKPKYEVARTFSALLQLVNGRSVDLDKGQATNELVCYTASNPFHVMLIGPNQRPEIEARFARKRVKSPLQNKGGDPSPTQQKLPKKQTHKNGKVPVKTAIKLTPDGKRRRRSTQMLRPINLESSG
ncbi:condensin-2 complex subunit H2 [Oryza brachyantha]|uniref:Condensin-2 complex subunit H2 n=1 Tax=Oryza brachyantha TaxID=4533 RepID=J3MLC8_ORYBR|nr:condensin-2 complex subunit H2 [Oryza brachyantha]